MTNLLKNENAQLAFIATMLIITAILNQGCTTINIIFTGSDSGPRPMSMGDAGLPMGDAGPMIEDDAALPLVDAALPETPLTVTMAATPSATIAVRNESFVSSVGLVLTAHEESEVWIRSLPVTGVGEIADSAFAPENMNDLVVACGLWDGSTRLGLLVTPDAVTGQMLFTGINLRIRAGASTTLTVLCTMDSVVSRETGDRYALGIVSAEGIVVESGDGDRLTAVIGMSLYTNTTVTPINIVTVMPHGSIVYETDNLRQSTILVADDSIWQNFAQIRATAMLEGADSDVVRITSRGDAASFTMVAVAADGAILGTCILPAGTDRSCDARLSSPFHVERDTSRIFQVWGRVPTSLRVRPSVVRPPASPTPVRASASASMPT